MVHRVFAIAAIVSTVLLGVTVFFLVVASNYDIYDIDPRQHRLVSITGDCHVTVARGRIVFFNNVEFGPYLGSILQIDGYPPMEKTGFGDTWGIYYRHLRWLDSGDVVWTAAISPAYPLLVFAVLPVTWGCCRLLRMRRRARELSSGSQP